MPARINTRRRLMDIVSVLQGRHYAFRRGAGSRQALQDQLVCNNELLQLLQCEVPEFLDRHPWVSECFAQRESWLRELAAAASFALVPSGDKTEIL